MTGFPESFLVDPQGKIESESGGFSCFVAQCIRLEDNGFGRLDCPRTEMPLVRRKKPGPTERLASAERFNRNEGSPPTYAFSKATLP